MGAVIDLIDIWSYCNEWMIILKEYLTTKRRWDGCIKCPWGLWFEEITKEMEYSLFLSFRPPMLLGWNVSTGYNSIQFLCETGKRFLHFRPLIGNSPVHHKQRRYSLTAEGFCLHFHETRNQYNGDMKSFKTESYITTGQCPPEERPKSLYFWLFWTKFTNMDKHLTVN